MSSNNQKNVSSSPKNHGPMKGVEKPKDFIGSIKKLIYSLKDFRVLIFIAIILAALSSILSLISPNKLSDLTDEISKGITINTDNMKSLEEDLTGNISSISDILDIKIDNDIIYKINSSNISEDDKKLFNST